MTPKKDARPPLVTDGAGRDNRDAQSIASSFPHCQLYDVKLVDRFPLTCPLQAPNPIRRIGELRDEAWASRHAGGALRAASLAQLDRTDVCNECIPRLLTHPSVRVLRDQTVKRHARA